ncbi:PorT family protein [Flavihumibacter sp. R14]|nr:PorT family protein [Flavihumibacter soli]
MKRSLIAVLLCACTGTVIAQEKPKPAKDTLVVITADTTKKDKHNRITIEFGKKDSADYDRDEKKHRPESRFSAQLTIARMDLGLSTYLDKGSFTLSPENSYLEYKTWETSNFGLEIFQMGYRFDNYFKIYLAAGFDWNHIRLKENITFQKNQPTLTYVVDTIEFDKNRFSSQYLRVPLSFQFRTKDDQRGNKVYFVLGPEVGFLLNGKVKQISSERGKEKFKDDYNFNPFRYGAFARIGYGDFGVYTKYYFNDVFADGQGPVDFKNLSFGFMLGF